MINPRMFHGRFGDAFKLAILLQDKFSALSRLLISTKDVNRDTDLNPSVVVSYKLRLSDTVLGQPLCLLIE